MYGRIAGRKNVAHRRAHGQPGIYECIYVYTSVCLYMCVCVCVCNCIHIYTYVYMFISPGGKTSHIAARMANQGQIHI